MNTEAFVRSLIVKGWTFWLKSEQLAYKAPKNTGTNETLKQLKEHKDELLTILRERPEVLNVGPVSDAQLSFWIQWQQEPENTSAILPYSVKLHSKVDSQRIRQAINGVMARHESLRTIFRFENGELIQQTLPAQKAEVEYAHVNLPDEDEANLKARIEADLKVPFQLDQQPALRMKLYTLSDSEHVLTLSMHHIIIDGLSHSIVLQEFIDNYERLCKGEPVNTTPLDATFSDFVHWQKRLIGSEKWLRMEEYWKNSLNGAPTKLMLPELDKTHASTEFEHGTVSVDLTEEQYRRLTAFSKQLGYTKYTILLSAFQALIYHHSGQDDLLIGSPLLGRTDHRFAEVVGFFLNSVVLRARMSRQQTFKDLLAQTSEVALGAIDNQDYLFTHLIDTLKPERNPDTTPFFQAWFNLSKYWQFNESNQKLRAKSATESGLVMEPFEITGQEADFDLVLQYEDNDKQLIGNMKFNASKYDGDLIETMASDYLAILDEVIREPEQVITEMSLSCESLVTQADSFSKGLPLSSQQARVWKQKQQILNKDILLGLELQGEIDRALLKTATEFVLQRHEIFSTRFITHQLFNSLLQTLDHDNLQWQSGNGWVKESTSLSTSEAWEQAKDSLPSYGENQIRHEVKLGIVECAGANHLLFISIPPLFVDATIASNLPEHILETYQTLQSKREPINEDPVQYIDIAEWAREFFDSEEANKGKEFWQQLDLNKDCVQPLCLDKLGLEIDQFEPSVAMNIELKDELVALLQQRSGHASTEAWLFAAWQVFLNSLSENKINFIGKRFDGRPDDEIATAVGPLARFLPVPSPIDNQHNAWQVVDVTNSFIGEAAIWQECFEWPDTTEDTNCLNGLPYLFEFDQIKAQWQLGRLHVNLMPFAVHGESFNLKLSCLQEQNNNSLTVSLHYNRNALNPSFAKTILPQFVRVLEFMLQEPDQSLSELNLLEYRENRQVASENNRLIHQLITETAETFSAKMALRCRDESFTYKQLTEVTALYIQRLVEAGVKPGDYVGVYARHSNESVIAILTILNAGAIYVPLDPEYPDDRLIYVVNDCALKTVLLGAEYNSFPLSSDVTAITLNASEVCQQASSTNLNHHTNFDISRDDAAYLIYTSGSTGAPKGTLISHGALADHAQSIADRFETGPDDTMLLFAPLNFDPSIEQCLVPLMIGATVHVKESGLWQPSDIASKIKDYGLTMVNFPTAFWHLLVIEWQRSQDYLDLTDLRMVIVGGDKIQPEMLRRWWRLETRNIKLLNAYGPTETTITATTADLSEEQILGYGQAPIGTPLNNRSLYVLSPAGKCLPAGAVGELYIGGIGLAKGYLNREDLSEKAFLPDPFSGAENARMYKTGDRAYYDVDGRFYFAGRFDSQVKISGYRIELMEIERTVSQIDAVTEAAVIVSQLSDDADNKQILVCYVANTINVTAAEISDYLATKLPSYMMPHGYVKLSEMPLGPSGKVDRKALITISGQNKISNEAKEPPATETESTLAEIWRETLNVEKINRQDNFTGLGGHSLLYLKLLSGIGERFGINLKLKDVFDASSLVAQAELIDKELRGGGESLHRLQLLPADRSEPLPLSFSQESLWLLSQLGHGLSYQMTGVIRFSKSLDVDLLKECLAILTQRHEALCTCFVDTEHGAVQRVEDQVTIPLEVVDNVSAKDGQAILARWKQAEMDLSQAPLMRVILIRDLQDQERLGVSLHHIVSDGLSTNILLKEMASLYNGMLEGSIPELPVLPIQYPDFAAWQRRSFNESSFQPDLEYWQSNLSGYQNLDIMPRRSRPQTLSGEGCRVSHTFSPKLEKHISAVTSQIGITKAAFLITAVHLLLGSYSQNKDFCIGMPTANRNRAELENVVGMLVNILVIRLGQTNMSVRELLKHANEVIKNGMAHQEVPFEKLVESLNPGRDPSRNPLFQVFFSFMEFNSVFDFAGEEVIFEPAQGNQSRFDLAFDFSHGADGTLTLDLEYSTELFVEGFISHMLENLTFVIEQLNVAHKANVASLDYVSPQQVESQLSWGKGEILAQVEPTQCNVIDEIFEQCHIRYDAPAITCGDITLSYSEFVARVADISAMLVSEGISPGDFVGVSVERSLNTSLAIIAVIRLGAVYVPIDPALPARRIIYILDDSGTKTLLTDQNNISALKELVPTDIKLLRLNNGSVADDGTAKHLDLPSGKLDVNKPAYVIYTSGSTGNPKGVAISLSSLTHCISAMGALTGFSNKDKTLAVATTSFDISVLDLLLPLSVGGELLIADDESVKNPEALAGLLCKHNATFLQATPTTFEMLFGAGWDNPTAVNLLSIGEPISTKLQQSFEKHKCRVWNGYGPTEATIYATAKELTPGCKISVGKAIANYNVYILDEQLKPIPTGAPGELYIGGPAVGIGYLNKPELTNEVFKDNPYATGEKFYKTGDLVRWIDQDGDMEIEYISRIDQQVKLRGYRIELGEIESVLDSLSFVDSTAVVVRTTPIGEQLVAYVVPKVAHEVPDLQELKTQLSRSLPSYMVPGYIELIDEMPLTPSKKLDKKQLKELPIQGNQGEGLTHESPVTETEDALLAMWQGLFKTQHICITDNFFIMGGHSLLMIQLQNQLQKEFEIKLPLSSLFKTPILREMAKVIERAAANRAIKILPEETPENVELSYNQQSLWVVDNLAGGTSAYNVVFSFQIEGDVRPDIFLKAWQAVQKRQASLRTYFEFSNGQVFQKVRNEVLQSLTIIDLSKMKDSEQHSEIQNHIDSEFSHVFNLKDDALFRLRMFKLKSSEYIIVLNLHHIIIDGWSVRLLLNEVVAYYESLLTDKPLDLPALEVSYADFSHWQRHATADKYFASQIEYWKKTLANCPKLSALPFDHPFSVNSNFNGVAIDANLSASQLQPLRELATSLETTLFNVLLSGWKLLLHLETGQTDIQIGTDVANRTIPEIESVIGLFMNQVTLRTKVEPSQSIQHLIAKVGKTIVDVFENQDVPFEKVVSSLGIERGNSVPPLFQSKFFMDYLPDEMLVTERFKITPREIELEAARLPLNFSLKDTGEFVKGKLVYDASLFEHSTVERMLARYYEILARMAVNTNQSLTSVCEAVIDDELERENRARQILRDDKLKFFQANTRRRTRLNS